eukprot:gene8543-6162_t
MTHRQPKLEEVFRFYVGDPTKPWADYRDQLEAIALEMQKEGYQDVDLDDPHDLDKFLYTIKEANPTELIDIETWNTDRAPEVFRHWKDDFIVRDPSGHWQFPSKPLVAFVDDRGMQNGSPRGGQAPAPPPPPPPPPGGGGGGQDSSPKARKSEGKSSHKYKLFMELWPDHPFAARLRAARAPSKLWKEQEPPELKQLWDLLREKTGKKDVPVRTWANATMRDMRYLHYLTPNLNETQLLERAILSPKEFYLQQSMIRDAERMTPQLREMVENPREFRGRVSDIAFYIYKALKDNTPSGFRKLNLEDPNLDTLRVVQVLVQMIRNGGLQGMVELFYADRNEFERFTGRAVADAGMQDEFDMENFAEGHGGAGVAAGGGG